MTRVAFFGTPAFALPVLQALQEQVVLVVSQPDKPVGRGLKLSPPPVATYATQCDLPLEQPRKLRGNAAFARQLRESGADVAVTCAYGKLLPAELLTAPRYGFLNAHTSLLPKLRGAAPIQWALIEGLTVTGTTIMQTDVGMDTGDILLQETLAILPHWTALDLSAALQEQAAQLMKTAIDNLPLLRPTPQDHAQATHAPPLQKADGDLCFSDGAREVYNRFRGVYAWPQSSVYVRGERVKVLEMNLAEGKGAPGEVLEVTQAGMKVACAKGVVRLISVQPAGKKAMPAADWSRGKGLKAGQRFDLTPPAQGLLD